MKVYAFFTTETPAPASGIESAGTHFEWQGSSRVKNRTEGIAFAHRLLRLYPSAARVLMFKGLGNGSLVYTATRED